MAKLALTLRGYRLFPFILNTNGKILISRTDNIGDVVLTLPLVGILKKNFPNIQICFLGRSYTRDLIEACEHIDGFIDREDFLKNDQKSDFDAIFHVHPDRQIAFHAQKIGIKTRVGALGRFCHWFTCNNLIRLSRKNSELHEAQLNLKFLSVFGLRDEYDLNELKNYNGIPKVTHHNDKTKVILHLKSNGNAPEWGLANFSKLIELLPADRYQIFISGTRAEKASVSEWIKQHPNVIDTMALFSLGELISFIRECDVLVASSTGPLHLAAALGKKAIGLYSPLRPMFPTRWAPLGDDVHVLLSEDGSVDVESIKAERVAELIIL